MVYKTGRYGKFEACSNYPECKYIKSEKKKAEPVMTDEVCPNCGSPIVIKKDVLENLTLIQLIQNAKQLLNKKSRMGLLERKKYGRVNIIGGGLQEWKQRASADFTSGFLFVFMKCAVHNADNGCS